MTIHPDVLGIDISKLHLDIHDAQVGTTRRIANTTVATATLAASLTGRACLVVFEATGRYDRVLREALAAAGIACPRQSRAGAPLRTRHRPTRQD